LFAKNHSDNEPGKGDQYQRFDAHFVALVYGLFKVERLSESFFKKELDELIRIVNVLEILVDLFVENVFAVPEIIHLTGASCYINLSAKLRILVFLRPILIFFNTVHLVFLKLNDKKIP